MRYGDRNKEFKFCHSIVRTLLLFFRCLYFLSNSDRQSKQTTDYFDTFYPAWLTIACCCYKCDFTVCVVILSPLKHRIRKQEFNINFKKKHSPPLFSNCSFIICLAARWDRTFPICWWIFILGCLPHKHDGRWYLGWSRDSPWCGKVLSNMYSRDQ